jgi:chemotaxis protein MotB
MPGMARRGRRTEINIWPAFVDAQAQLVMGIIFLLTVFTVAQIVTTDALSGRDQALAKLNQQLNELNDLLALERRANADLRLNAAQLSSELQSSSAARDALTTRVAELAAKAQDEQARADRLAQQLADANQTVAADKEKVTLQLKELESIRRDIEALKKVRDDLEAKVTQLAASQDQAQKDLTAARDRTKELEAKLSSAEERTALAQKDIQQKDVRLSEAQDQITLLAQQIAALRDQIARVSAALELAEKEKAEQATTIADLGKRLNMALASKVEELARYRSEFFGRLRQILGDRPDIRVVGDRFVFQSEVLFAPGSADLGDDAKKSLQPIATALSDLMKKIPSDINWVLRVDGHTDKRPISTAQFPSNWELSTARAISVVKFLAASGIPPERLAAAGYAEFEPLDNRDDEIAYRRNRRIELKLTDR